MQAAALTGPAKRLNSDIIPFRRRIGDAPAPWSGRGESFVERPVRAFARDDDIFVEGNSAAIFYKLVRGAVRTYRLLNDGRRQIDAFHFAGDVFGLEGWKPSSGFGSRDL